MKNSIKSKTCTKCGEIKELSAFSKRKCTKDGLQYECKDCAAVYTKIYRDSHKVEIAAHDKAYCKTPEGKAVQARGSKKYRIKFPEKVVAQSAVTHAILRKELIRPSVCNCCGKACVPEAHHWCYRKAYHLDVIWLCSQCHVNLHKTLIYNPATWEYQLAQ